MTDPAIPGRRSGSTIIGVLMLCVVLGVLGLALVTRNVRGMATGRWSRDHVALRLLAESATEELRVIFQSRVNTAGDPVGQALRSLAPSTEPRPLGPFALVTLPSDLPELGRELDGVLVAEPSVVLLRLETSPEDPGERVGLVALEARVRLSRPGQPVRTERFRLVHAMRIARTGLPPPLDQAGLLILETSARDFKSFRGQMAHAPARGATASLLEMMTRRASSSFGGVPTPARQAVRRALSSFSPEKMQARAQFVLRSVDEVRATIVSRLDAGGRVDGSLHITVSDTIRLDQPRFRGRCVLSFTGPVEVGEIQLDDPRRDSLTLVSPAGIVVTGARVQANLVDTSGGAPGLILMVKTSVTGTVVASRFPQGFDLTASDLGGCRFAFPETSPASRDFLALSPYALDVLHRRDSDE